MTLPPAPEIVIAPGQADRNYWRDLWRYRELLGFLAWRDIKVRYKQAVLGVAWAILQPVVTMVIFTFVFGRLAGMPSGGLPYELLVLSGLLPWQLFSAALAGASGSLVGNAHLISKVYFPRLVVPLSSLGVALIDFLLVLVLFAGVQLWFGELPSWRWLVLPVFVLLALGAALALGLWFTALTVKYRDFRFVVPFLLQVGLFVSPVGYRADLFPNWQHLLALNPLTGIIDGFRWCLLNGRHDLQPATLAATVGMILFAGASGLWFFRRTERSFADVI